MEALRASYGDTSSDSESDSELIRFPEPSPLSEPAQSLTPLPPPPLHLLNTPNALGMPCFTQCFYMSMCSKCLISFFFLKGASDFSSQSDQPNRVRCFPHVEGNFALHVYIPGDSPSSVIYVLYFVLLIPIDVIIILFPF